MEAEFTELKDQIDETYREEARVLRKGECVPPWFWTAFEVNQGHRADGDRAVRAYLNYLRERRERFWDKMAEIVGCSL